MRPTVVIGVLALGMMLNGCAFFPSEGPIQYVSDQKLNSQVKKAVETAVPGDYANLKVSTFDKYVRLDGRFSTEENRQAAVKAARGVKGVREVLDYAMVAPQNGVPTPPPVKQVSSTQW